MQSIFRAAIRPRSLPALLRKQAPTNYPNLGIRTLITKRYTKEHETISYDDSTGLGTVTITDHAQSTLGDVVFVELKTVGTVVEQNDAIGAVESVKAASDIYSPVSGTIKEVNGNLADQPNLLNKSAESDGWLCKIEMSNPAEMDELLSEEAYAEFVEES